MGEHIDDRLRLLRDAIDTVDERLIALLNERAQLAIDVGKIKHGAGAPVFRPEREAEILQRAGALNAGPLSRDHVTHILREVISACRALERPLTVAYLGPVGTFSEMAMQRQFGSSVTGLPCATLDDVFRTTEAGSADLAIVPLENSSEGAVNRTLDLLLATPLGMLAEVSVSVQHNLLTKSGSMSGVVRVCAHAQALAQCAGWLNQHWPSLERQPVASNAEAARMASEDATIGGDCGRAGSPSPQYSSGCRADSGRHAQSHALRCAGCAVEAAIDAIGARQDVADPFGAQQGRRGVSHVVAIGRTRSVDDALRVAAGARGHLGVLLLRRRRRPPGRAESCTRAHRVAAGVCVL